MAEKETGGIRHMKTEQIDEDSDDFEDLTENEKRNKVITFKDFKGLKNISKIENRYKMGKVLGKG